MLVDESYSRYGFDVGPVERSYARRPTVPLSSPAPSAAAQVPRVSTAVKLPSSLPPEIVRLAERADTAPVSRPSPLAGIVISGTRTDPVYARSDGSVATSRLDTVRPTSIPERRPEPPAPVQTLFAPGQVRGAMPAQKDPAARKLGNATTKSLSPGDTTVQEAEQRAGGQNAGAALALVGVAAVVLAAFVL